MRVTLIWTALLTVLLAAGNHPSPAAEPAAGENPQKCINRVCPQFLITPAQARALHAQKDKLGPAFSGNKSWQHYMQMVEQQLNNIGAQDVTLNSWTYDRWHTSEWPDDSLWSLTVDGKPIKVASYGAYSGSTSAAGVSAPLVYYDAEKPPADLAGKIVVFQPRLSAEEVDLINGFDYESHSADASFPQPGGRVPADIHSVSSPIWAQLLQLARFMPVLKKSKAAGAVFVFDSTYDQMAGLYTFPVPAPYDAPSLFLDRKNGAPVVDAAKSGASATLKLVADVTPTITWQLIAFLPGQHYGTPQNETILFTTHSDGPSISQENGPLGQLAVAYYFAHIPQAQRPRTLAFFMDNRHFMPGGEAAFAKRDWLAKHSGVTDQVVAVVGVEHLGQIEFVEHGDGVQPSGRVDPSNLWVTNNQKLIDLAVKAVDDNHLPGVFIRVPARPGKQGRSQGPWYGLGRLANVLGKPGFATMGTMGVYWSTASRLDRFDANLFCRQIATVAQLTGELMLADMKDLQTKADEGAGAN
jgi:hypothetical protein